METPEVSKALKHNFLFAPLSDEQVDALARQVWIERIPARSVIVREGEEADALYVVVAGSVNVTKGDGQFLAYLGPGGFFGEMALFDRERRSATVRAIGEARVLTVDKRTFLRRIHEDPSLAFRIVKGMSQRIRKLDDQVARLEGER